MKVEEVFNHIFDSRCLEVLDMPCIDNGAAARVPEARQALAEKWKETIKDFIHYNNLFEDGNIDEDYDLVNDAYGQSIMADILNNLRLQNQKQQPTEA